MSAPLFAAHSGRHAALQSPRPAIFRRALRTLRRKPAVPDAAPVAPGTATAQREFADAMHAVSEPYLPPAPLPQRQGWAPITQEPPRPEMTGPARAWDPGDGLASFPLVPRFVPQPVYGERCQLDVAEAERLSDAASIPAQLCVHCDVPIEQCYAGCWHHLDGRESVFCSDSGRTAEPKAAAS